MGLFFCVCKPPVGLFSLFTQAVIFQGDRKGKKKKLDADPELATHPALRSLISLIRKMYGQTNDKWSGGRENTVQRNTENKKNKTGMRGRILLGMIH